MRRVFVILCAVALFSAGLATLLASSNATAQQPEPGVNTAQACPSPSPSPSPSTTPVVIPTLDPDATPDDETPDPEDPCDEDDDNIPGGNHGGGPNGDGGNGNGGGNNGPGDPNKDGSSKTDKNDHKNRKDGKAKKGHKKDRTNKKKDKSEKSPDAPKFTGKFLVNGEFDTDKLQLIAAQLRGKGLTEEQIVDRVYTPFILAGPAAWTDTWGAPRYGPGPIVRTHEGQDVFCKYGDPVLATHAGEIEFDDGGLGGRVARLYSEDGSYFYYAHLSGWNNKEFSNGDRVKAGDVIGYCGNTGNAITTPPHVHFGWYQANGEARNPMWVLVRWLRTAERSAGVAYKQVYGHSIRFNDEETTSRLFGDSFAPDTSELRVSSDGLLATGGDALGLAEAALQAALAAETEEAYPNEVTSTPEGAGDSHSELAELLENSGQSPAPVTDQAD
ncbi:MAG TPA: M23 family metallopeptidase [Actinomycetota bacterium]|nr:M23 family metallopeptidase [Actinomycetota bacterium]